MNRAGSRLPLYEDVHFDAAQLEQCVVQVRFPSIPRFADPAYLADIKDALSLEYPLLESVQVMSVIATPQGISQSPSGTMLRFSTIDHSWTVGLDENSVSLESREYSNINEFSGRFTNILSDVAAYLKPRHQLRFGLRYINEFRHRKGDSYAGWQQLLNPELMGLAAQNIIDGTVEQTIAEIRTRRNDGTVLVRHGFLQNTTVMPASGRAPKSGPFYLLDLDYFDETPHKFDAQAPATHMIEYNAFLYRIFRWAIGEGEFYQFLGGK